MDFSVTPLHGKEKQKGEENTDRQQQGESVLSILSWWYTQAVRFITFLLPCISFNTSSEVFNNFDDILLRGFVIKSRKLVINKPSLQSSTAVLSQARIWLESWACSQTFQKAAFLFFSSFCVGYNFFRERKYSSWSFNHLFLIIRWLTLLRWTQPNSTSMCRTPTVWQKRCLELSL